MPKLSYDQGVLADRILECMRNAPQPLSANAIHQLLGYRPSSYKVVCRALEQLRSDGRIVAAVHRLEHWSIRGYRCEYVCLAYTLPVAKKGNKS